METFIVYLSLSFFTLWIVAFSLSVGTVIWFQFIHLVSAVNYRLDEIGHQISEVMHRLLFYLHLSR